MHISVLDPIGRAIERTGQILFKPFDLRKWFVLGFCAFLAHLGGGGGNFPGNMFTGRGGPGGAGGPARIGPWIQANLPLVISCAILGLAAIIGLTALFTWLSSRGKFMFLDGIVRNHGAVVEPWRAFRPLGNSLFGFSFLLGLSSMLAVLIVVAIGAGLAWPDIQAGRFGSDAWMAVIVGGLLFLVTIFILAVVSFLLEDFVIPAMYLRDQRVLEAWATVRQEVLPGNLGPIVLFYLMKIVLGIGVATIAVVATCATCCLAALPYLGSVILLPLFVFGRCYTLYFVEQFGPQWRFFGQDGWPPRCSGCGYDLRYNESGYCPECGMPIAANLPPPPPPQPESPH